MAPIPKKKLTLTMGDVDGGESTYLLLFIDILGFGLADIAEGELNLDSEKLQYHYS